MKERNIMKDLNLKPVIKRIGAYMIDIIIVLIIATSITNIPLINKHFEEYQTLYQEYQEKYQEYTNTTSLLNNSYQDKTLTKEEYDKLIENNTYKDIISKYYEDELLEEKEYNALKKEIDTTYKSLINDYSYNLQKKGIYNSIITLTTTLIYFGVIQYLLKGQTIGKKLLHLKVVSANDKKITILNYLLRSLIVNNVFLNGINLIFLNYFSKEVFTKCDSIISFLVSFVEALIIYLVLIRKDNRGLHDLACNTKVIELNS